MPKLTGLKDDYGNAIHDGDMLLWSWKPYPGYFPATKVRTFKQIIRYEVRGDSAGYFLDRPNGLAVFQHQNKIKYKVIKRSGKPL